MSNVCVTILKSYLDISRKLEGDVVYKYAKSNNNLCASISNKCFFLMNRYDCCSVRSSNL